MKDLAAIRREEEAALAASSMAAAPRRSRQWLLLVTVMAGLLMIVASKDFADFAPIRVSPYFLHALMTLEGVLAVHAGRDTKTLLLFLVAVNVLSLAIYVGVVLAAMHAVGIPLRFDFVVAWTVQPIFMYSAFGVVLGFFGVLVGMIWHPW